MPRPPVSTRCASRRPRAARCRRCSRRELRVALLRLSRNEQAKALGERALRALAGFAKALKVKYQDIEVGLDFEPEPGLADNGDLEHDLAALLEAVGAAAQRAGTALVLFIDELQYVKEDELAALITGLHRTAQRKLPVGARRRRPAAAARPHGACEVVCRAVVRFPGDRRAAAAGRARKRSSSPRSIEGVEITEDALERILVGDAALSVLPPGMGQARLGQVAEGSPITLKDVAARVARSRSPRSMRASSVFASIGSRSQKRRYLRAMAELGPGPHRSGDVAEALGRKVTSLAPIRNQLIAKGMIFSPSHGDTAFTVPLFDEFLRRVMPGDDWRE